MNKALAAIKQSQMNMWDDKEKQEEMKKLICKVKLSEVEFATFIELGKATQLNPFLKEIWVVKYDEKSPASIFIGRDGYRKAAQRDPEYDFHEADAVYSNDKFKRNSITGDIQHEYNLKDRGELLGAYCIVKRKSSERPSYTWVKLSEYSTGKSLWNPHTGKPETMIKKVAECQGLRACFQDLLGGTYSQEEMERDELTVFDGDTGKVLSKSEQRMNKIKSAKGQVIEAETVENQEETGEAATPEQMKEIHALIAVKGFANGRMQKAMEYYEIETLGQLTKAKADNFIARLNKEPDL
jgi:phage recombination protein Bet